MSITFHKRLNDNDIILRDDKGNYALYTRWTEGDPETDQVVVEGVRYTFVTTTNPNGNEKR